MIKSKNKNTIIILGIFILIIAMGLRQSFGLFIPTFSNSYDILWWACVFLSLFVAFVHINMDDKKIDYANINK